LYDSSRSHLSTSNVVLVVCLGDSPSAQVLYKTLHITMQVCYMPAMLYVNITLQPCRYVIYLQHCRYVMYLQMQCYMQCFIIQDLH